jgi:neural Wiskott-Aldrich syndrome protein
MAVSVLLSSKRERELNYGSQCTNCAAACKRCDEARPCERCIKYGIADACVDGTRKERKKGIKRGPYKRKNKSENGDISMSSFSF